MSRAGGTTTGRHWHRLRVPALLAIVLTLASADSFAQERPRVGVAFGGGSARGIAHVGVIRWFEEHHIPIDMTAGTSMGGLIGGSFATGMDAAALQAMLGGIDWDKMFGFSSFAFKNIRRKGDARAYPSRLEFGVRNGVVLPPALNNGQQVDLLITGIAAPYFADPTFATLPTPFKAVAVDLRTAEAVVLDRGSLARAMRATMSLPGVFPPVEVDGKVLVDGGVMNNVPADVVRAMGADTVIAVNVGDLSDQEDINYSIFALAGATIDAMMRANTKRAVDVGGCRAERPAEEVRIAGLAPERRPHRRRLQGRRGDEGHAPSIRNQRGGVAGVSRAPRGGAQGVTAAAGVCHARGRRRRRRAAA